MLEYRDPRVLKVQLVSPENKASLAHQDLRVFKDILV